MQEMNTATPVQTSGRRTRTSGWVALLLVSAGALLLAGRLLPAAGDALALVLGVESIAWARVAREKGPLVGGAIATCLGVGILLAAGPLEDAASNVIGGTLVLCAAAGFALIGVLSRLWLNSSDTGAWIAAAALAVVGGSLSAGAEVLGAMLRWAMPTALVLAGAIVAIRWKRDGQ